MSSQKSRVTFTPSENLEVAMAEMTRRQLEANLPPLARSQIVEYFAEMGWRSWSQKPYNLHEEHKKVKAQVLAKTKTFDAD